MGFFIGAISLETRLQRLLVLKKLDLATILSLSALGVANEAFLSV